MAHPRFESETEMSRPDFCWTSQAPEQSRSAARALGACVAGEGLVLALVGPLGAGKTLFVKGFAEGLGIDPARVTSPTFVIAGEYSGPNDRRLHHVDLYRVESVPELEQAGFLDMLDPGAVIAVEWADRFLDELPRDHLRVDISRDAPGPDSQEIREIAVRAAGPGARAVLERWQNALQGLAATRSGEE